jgi:ADP-heptose:LPS heptosyltransferase
MLLINFDGLGDIVLMSGVVKHYKKDFPNKKIYLAVRANVGVDRSLFGDFIDEVIYFDADAFKKNPIYGLRFVNDLRKIGFAIVINHDPSVGEILGKDVAARLGAKEVIGYEGLGIQFAHPYDSNMEMGIRYV